MFKKLTTAQKTRLYEMLDDTYMDITRYVHHMQNYRRYTLDDLASYQDTRSEIMQLAIEVWA